MRGLIVGWLIVFSVIGGVVFYLEGIEALVGVGIAAVIALVIMLRQLRSQWSGTVVSLEEKQVHVPGNDDEPDRHETRVIAHVRLNTGRTKKMNAHPSWSVGDNLVKRRGDSSIQINP